jgi:hypothetical protein
MTGVRKFVQVGIGIVLIFSVFQISLHESSVSTVSADLDSTQNPTTDAGTEELNDPIAVANPSGPRLGSAVNAGGKWTKMAPTVQPAGRRGHALSSIYGTDKVLLFGGFSGGYHFGDTWIYDFSDDEWTDVDPPGSVPTGRHSHAMSPIYGTDWVLLFGGTSGYDLNDETWLYDSSNNIWMEMAPSNVPTARKYHDMAPIIGDDKVVLFSGFDGTYVDDTWIFDLSEGDWNKRPQAVKPQGRKGHEMASIYGSDEVVLFGGNVSGIDVANDTWMYNTATNEWTELNPSGDVPGPRRGHGTANFHETDKMLLFGPEDVTWIYDVSDNTWTIDVPPISPSSRYIAHGIAPIYFDDKVVLFGGGLFDVVWHDLNDTWVYDLNSFEGRGSESSLRDAGHESSSRIAGSSVESSTGTQVSSQLPLAAADLR